MSATPRGFALPGCTPEPLMAYLKALGILRLVREQKDSNARCWWENDIGMAVGRQGSRDDV